MYVLETFSLFSWLKLPGVSDVQVDSALPRLEGVIRNRPQSLEADIGYDCPALLPDSALRYLALSS